jgi:hypothetical protein
VEIGLQVYQNYKNGCDPLDIDNYDLWDVGVATAVGAFGPGWWAVGKTAWTSSKAIGVLSAQSTNTANRAAKIAARIQKNKNQITGIVATQVGFQGAKAVGKAITGSNPQCACNK